MWWNILSWYVIISYIVGISFFVLDISLMLMMRNKAIRAQKHTGMNLSRYIKISPAIKIGIVVVLFSPLTAWHAALHYAAVAWAKLTNKPIKYWV